MTCHEFKRLFNETSPLDCTRAERAAHVNHRNTCQECADWFSAEAKLVVAAATPAQLLYGLVKMSHTMDEDRQDPEFSE